MCGQAFGETEQGGSIGLLQSDAKIAQYLVIAFHLRHKRLFPRAEKQRQKHRFLDDEMGIELSEVRAETDGGRGLDERSIA